MRVAAALRSRLQTFVAGPDRVEAGAAVVLDRRRVYILPTVPGLVLGAATLVLLVGSMNYGLQLGFLLTFVVVAMAVVGMYHTHRNLAQLELRGHAAAAVFAGDVASFEFAATNSSDEARHALRCSFVPRGRSALLAGSAAARAAFVSIDLAARGTRGFSVPLAAPRRGRLVAPRLCVETRFPFGLWRAWALVNAPLAAIVYPRPESDAPRLPAGRAGGHGDGGSGAAGDDFAGVRPYQAGDSATRILWKRAAHADALTVKLFEASGGTGETLLDYASLPGALDAEARLARLARWVLDADAAALRYTLQLPGVLVGPGEGPGQRERSLTALALWGTA